MSICSVSKFVSGPDLHEGLNDILFDSGQLLLNLLGELLLGHVLQVLVGGQVEKLIEQIILSF